MAFLRSYRATSLAVCLALTACAQFVRDDAAEQLRAGQYELAIQSLEAGLAKYPDSSVLRAGIISARNEATARLTSEAAQQRGAGRFDEADKTLQRAQALDPGNERLQTLRSELQAERRAQLAIDEAVALVTAGKKADALRRVELGLRDAPRNPGLVTLQRRLEADMRYDVEASGRGRGLAETRPITLDFRGASLSTVLDAITRGSGINFILDRDVRQDARVTVFLRSARVEDAIDLVLSANNLTRRIVDPQTVLIFANTAEKLREHQEQVVRVFQLSNADAKSTAAMLRSALRIREAYVDERANLVVLRESPEIIAVAERLVALQDMGEPEVMLEVEILEVKRTRLTELGINFPSTFVLTPLNATGGTDLVLDDVRNLSSSRIGVTMPSLIINLRREVGDVNILANPRIRTRSKEKARILIGDKVPVVTTTTSSTGFVSENVTYLDVGLKLEAEPVVSPDDEVSIRLALEVSNIAGTARTAGGSTVYQIGTRNANTVLRLRDGETQLLAGLISSDDRMSANRVPGLGDLPIAGRLFSSQKDDIQRTELVLAITPRIVRTAYRPDVAQSELWVGSESSTRLRPSPYRPTAAAPAAAATPMLTPGGAAAQAPATVAIAAPSADAARGQNPQAAAGPVTLSWNAPAEAAVGQTFTATLVVSAATPLRSVPLEIGFPADSVEVVGINEGEFFRQANVAASFIHAIRPEQQRISVGLLATDAAGAAGRNSVLQLQLRARRSGRIELPVSSFRPIGVGEQPQVAPAPPLVVNVR